MDYFLIANDGRDNFEAVEARRKTIDELWKKIEMKECLLRLKLGHNWLKDGDCNSKFFHKSIKERICRNSFTLMYTPARVIDGVREIKSYIRQHYADFFKEPCNTRHVPEGIYFNRLADEEVSWME